jgi:hypothetical protein
MAPPPCAICKTEIEDDSEKFECDGCCKSFHQACDGIKKGDVTARSKSNNLKLFCNDCVKKKVEFLIADRLGIIYKYVTKIDETTQKQNAQQAETDDKIKNVTDTLAETIQKIKEMKNTTCSAQSNDNNNKPSFANVVRKAAKPSVLIKPKAVQSATTTSDEIKKQIDRREVNACALRKLHGGAIVVTCDSNASTVKMKTMIQDKFGDKYEVNLPNVLKPRVKIFRIDGVDEHDIVNELKERNEWLVEGQIEVKKIIKRKDAKYDDFDAVIEVDNDCFDKLMESGRVNLGWRSCRVVHHVHITRCFKCCGFGHIAANCSNKLACSKCGDEHKVENCKSEAMKCVNCHMLNEKFKMKLDTNHRPWNNVCETLKRRVDRFARNFNVKEKQ